MRFHAWADDGHFEDGELDAGQLTLHVEATGLAEHHEEPGMAYSHAVLSTAQALRLARQILQEVERLVR